MESSDPRDYIFSVSLEKDRKSQQFVVILDLKNDEANYQSEKLNLSDFKIVRALPRFLETHSGNDHVLFVTETSWKIDQIVMEMERLGFTYSDRLGSKLENFSADYGCDRGMKTYFRGSR